MRRSPRPRASAVLPTAAAPGDRGGRTRSIDRAPTVLWCIASKDEERGRTDLNRLYDLSPGTLRGVGRSRAAHGLREQDGKADRHGLGQMVLMVGAPAGVRGPETGDHLIEITEGLASTRRWRS